MAQAAESLTATPALPATPFPTVCQIATGFLPAIYHPERAAKYLRLESFPRKTKATAAEALAYATRKLWYRQRDANEKRRRNELRTNPGHWSAAA